MTKGTGIISRHVRALTISFTAALSLLFVLPVGSSGLKVGGLDVDKLTGDATKSLGLGGSSGDSGGQPSTTGDTRSGVPGTPPGYNPPAHGSNPHGQGTVATVELPYDSTAANPYPGDPTAGPELVVVGRSKGEQNPNGTYEGNITIVGLFGNEVIGVHTDEGQSDSSPLDPLNSMVLQQLCTASTICLGLLVADSETNGSGSANSFTLASASLLTGPNNVAVTAGESNGNISDNGTCQTAYGDSQVLSAAALGAVTAGLSSSSSESTACNDGSAPTVTQTGSVLNLNGPVGLPTAACGAGTPDAEFNLAGVLGTVCNADDTNGAQMPAPYGVREALSVFVLPVAGGIVKVGTAASESHAVAPPGPPGGPGAPLIGPGGGGGPGGNPGRTVDEADVPGAVAEAAQAGPAEDLAFTGADLLLIALFGCGILAAGLTLSLAGRGLRTA